MSRFVAINQRNGVIAAAQQVLCVVEACMREPLRSGHSIEVFYNHAAGVADDLRGIPQRAPELIR